MLHRLLGECAGNRTQSHQNLESYVHFTYGSVILFFLNSRLRNRGMHTLLFPQEVAPIIWKEHQDSNLGYLPYRRVALPQRYSTGTNLVGVTFVGFRFRSAIGRCSKELVGRVLRAYSLSFHTHCLAMVAGLEPATYGLTVHRSTD